MLSILEKIVKTQKLKKKKIILEILKATLIKSNISIKKLANKNDFTKFLSF